MKIKKVEKLVDNLHDKKEYVKKKSSFLIDESFSFWKNHEKCKKPKRYQTCDNRSKKKLNKEKSKLYYMDKDCFI